MSGEHVRSPSGFRAFGRGAPQVGGAGFRLGGRSEVGHSVGMFRNACILAAAAAVVALPFLFRRDPAGEVARPGDPVLVIISPHNEAIRYEFGRAFSEWHRRTHGRPVKVEWLAIGGTTEIARYLEAQYIAAVRAWWRQRGERWLPGAEEAMFAARFPAAPPLSERRAGESEADYDRRAGEERARWETLRALHDTWRTTDDPAEFTVRADLFFGGGQYDHDRAHGRGLTVLPWPPDRPPPGIFDDERGVELIPRRMSGEIWRTDAYFGCTVSAFGICWNHDRVREIGIAPPRQWEDLAQPAYFRQIGVADPTKSGSLAKAFEMIIHQQCRRAVERAGFTPEQVAEYERRYAEARDGPAGSRPEGVPESYDAAIARGWLDGLNLLRRIGANARYFTDSAGKVPIDVSQGQAAAGLAIDFYARYQAQYSRAPDGSERMGYVTPVGGSSVSADPISLLRGAEHRALAVEFIRFVLGEDGQRLWNQRPGTPGGPERFALRRLPIRRDFYPSDDPVFQAAYEARAAYAADDLAAPDVNPYILAAAFEYEPRWTGRHFGVQRDIVKAMCLDSFDELRAAWGAILDHGGPEANPEAMEAFEAMPDRPEPLRWDTAPDIARRYDRMDYLRDWTAFFRASYRRARERALAGR